MKKLFFFFILFTTHLWAFSQDQAVADSLYQILNNLENDSSKMKVMGLIIQNENDPDRKRSLAEDLIDIAQVRQSVFYKHQGFLHIGQSYRIQGDFDLAVESLIKSLKLAEESKFNSGIIASTTALADVYSIYGDYKNAIQYYNRSIEIMGANDSSLHAVTLLNLGDTYYMTQNFDSALVCFEQSMLIYDALGDLSGRAYNLGNIGLVKAEKGNLLEAENDVAKSIEQLESLGDHYGSCIFLGYMSDIYFNQSLLEKAYVFADSCLRIGSKFGMKAEVRDNYLRISNIYAKKGAFESAYEYYKDYTSVKDSISNEEVFSRIESLESAFELSQAQAEVALLTAEKKNHQAMIVTALVTVIALGILAIVIFIYYRNKIKINRVLENQKIALERLNETKDKFFSIISHDLRGPVNSLFGVSQLIRHFVQGNDTNQLLDMADHMETSIERLSNLLDNLLNWAMQQQGHFPNVPEKVELKSMIDEIISMFSNMASGKQLALHSNIDEEIYLWVDKNSTHTIFRNLVNNAIKFTNNNGEVTVDSMLSENEVTILVKDNGIGITNEKLKRLFNESDGTSTYGTAGEKGLGLGLNLVKEFITMNNGNISVDSSLSEGTVFSITLPLFEARKPEVAVQS